MEVIQYGPGTSRVPFTDLTDLASERVGGKVLFANDEFFAEKENLIKPERAVFIPGKYTENGKWMDGWESRRKRVDPAISDHDFCVIKLGIPGVICGFNVDTDFFVGNYPEYCAIDGLALTGEPSSEQVVHGAWKEIVPKTRLQGGTQNYIPLNNGDRWTHLRLRIYPDGGVARFRVHGIARPDLQAPRSPAELIDLAAIENGGTVITCNDAFFGARDNLIMPGRSRNMGDGWETRRRRGPGSDWIVVKLGAPGIIRKIEVDTNHFKGNYPDSCAIDGINLQTQALLPEDFARRADLAWFPVLSRTKLKAHTQHFYEKEIIGQQIPSTHVRLTIFPDGGISRLRVHCSRMV